MQVQIAGFAWFQRDSYLTVRAMFEDGHKLPRTYDEWVAKAEALRHRLRAQGIRVVEVEIDSIQFPAWCAAQGRRINADARQHYASYMAARVAMGGGGGGGVGSH